MLISLSRFFLFCNVDVSTIHSSFLSINFSSNPYFSIHPIEKEPSCEKPSDQTSYFEKGSRGDEPTNKVTKLPDNSASALTETGDFDYRQPVAKPEEANEEHGKSVTTDPFGLGSGVSGHEDADLRLLKAPVSYFSRMQCLNIGSSQFILMFRFPSLPIPLPMPITDNFQYPRVLQCHHHQYPHIHG